jgi:hypothetical protein
MHARRFQRPRNPIDGRAHGFTGSFASGTGFTSGKGGVGGCVG